MIKKIVVFSFLSFLSIFSENLNDNCKLDNNLYSDEFDSLVGYDYGYDFFKQIKPNKKKCEYITEIPFFNIQTIKNFTCSKDDCFRWCSYLSACDYSQYSEITKECSRSTGMQLTDNTKMYKQYFKDKIVTYARNNVKIPYYSQLCNGIRGRKRCNSIKNCKWNRGKIGYNNELYGNNMGYCGRTGCN